MTNDSKENKIVANKSAKLSVTERIRQITSAALMAGSLFMGSSADAAIPPRHSSAVDRAVAIQDVLKSKIATDGDVAEKLPRAQLLLAHWGNRWGNWSNWNNWNNWRNWNKWRNWGNWLNF